MKKFIPLTIGLLAIVFLLAFAVGQGKAQQANPENGRPADPQAPTKSSLIPIQGRLTDASGNPLTGSYDLTFKLYDIDTGGTALCTDIVTGVNVEMGLFNTYMNMQGCIAIDGRQLYLGIQVGTDPEMTPRQTINNVPYAWTLRPGAQISSTIGNDAILDIDNYSSTGRGVRAEAQATTGVNYAVIGASRSPDGYGGYFYNNGGGVGLYGSSDLGIGVQANSLSGAAIAAGGTGIITSTAKSSLWISGNGVRPYLQGDSTVINMDTIGGAKISRGATTGFKNVMLPITIPGVLYGQGVKVTGMDIYWVGDTDFEAITAVLLRRQTGVCANCYASILSDFVDHTCWEDDFDTGCVQHYDLTQNNVLSADSGVLYLTLEMGFAGETTWIEIGGVKLTLEYDN